MKYFNVFWSRGLGKKLVITDVVRAMLSDSINCEDCMKFNSYGHVCIVAGETRLEAVKRALAKHTIKPTFNPQKTHLPLQLNAVNP